MEFKELPFHSTKILLKQWKSKKYKRRQTVAKKLTKITNQHIKYYDILNPYRAVHSVMGRNWDHGKDYTNHVTGWYGKQRKGAGARISWAEKILAYCLTRDFIAYTGTPNYQGMVDIMDTMGIYSERTPKNIQRIVAKTSFHDVLEDVNLCMRPARKKHG